MDTSFLSSNRFWALVVTSASIMLVDPNFGVDQWWVTLGKFLGMLGAGFTAIRTIDRNTGDTSQVTTVTMPEGVKSVEATTKKK